MDFQTWMSRKPQPKSREACLQAAADSYAANRLIFKLLIFLITYLLNTVCYSLDSSYSLVTT